MDYRDNPQHRGPHNVKWTSFAPPGWTNFAPPLTSLFGWPEKLLFAASLAPRLLRHGVHYGWVIVALTMLISICTSASVSLTGVIILPMIEEFEWSRADVSIAMGLMLVMFAAVAPFAGALLLRYGLRRVVTVAALMTTIALAATTQASERWHLLISLGLLLGTAAGMVALALSATVANRWFVKHRGLAMGVLTAAFAAGQLTFLPAAAWLAANHGWRMAVLPALIGAGICAVLYILFARDWPADIVMAPYGETKIQPPERVDASNVVRLSVRPETLCRITEFSEHESNGRELDEGERVAVEVLPVLGQSAAAVEPGDGAFDHPTPGLDDEALHPIGSLDDLGLEIGQDAGQGAVKDRALIGAVGEQFPEKGKQTEQGRQQRETAAAILNGGGGADAVQQQALRIDQNMPLLALDQLAGIEAVAVDASPPFSALFTL